MHKRAEKAGIWGAGLLGIVFSLSFCPVSAALFFGSLIPLSVKYNSTVLLPSLYGVDSVLPVILFAILLTSGARFVDASFNKLTSIKWWAQRITGGIFIAVGIYYAPLGIFLLC